MSAAMAEYGNQSQVPEYFPVGQRVIAELALHEVVRTESGGVQPGEHIASALSRATALISPLTQTVRSTEGGLSINGEFVAANGVLLLKQDHTTAPLVVSTEPSQMNFGRRTYMGAYRLTPIE